MLSSNIGRLRLASLTEGVSFLVLVGIAMPLKYLAGIPLAVKVVGWAHGLLFVVLVILLLGVMVDRKWKLSQAAMVFVAALIPLGPFLIDKRLKALQDEAATNPAP